MLSLRLGNEVRNGLWIGNYEHVLRENRDGQSSYDRNALAKAKHEKTSWAHHADWRYAADYGRHDDLT